MKQTREGDGPGTPIPLKTTTPSAPGTPAGANASSAERSLLRSQQRVNELKQLVRQKKECRRQEAERLEAEREREEKYRLEALKKGKELEEL